MKSHFLKKRQPRMKSSFLCGMALLPALVAGCNGDSNGSPVVPPPSSQCGTGNATATFVGTNTNADLSTLNATKVEGALSTTNGALNAVGVSFSNECDANISRVRLFTMTLNKNNSTIEVGQSYSLTHDASIGAPPAPLTSVIYVQYNLTNSNIGEVWEADAGNVTITAINGDEVAFSLQNAHFVPRTLTTFAPGTGTFTLNASGRIAVDRSGN